MASESLKRIIDSLQKIYTVIISLAIGKTLQETFVGQNWEEILDIAKNRLPTLLSFFAVIIPFYHGMNRHLDICYVEKTGEFPKLGLVIDFFFFCIESSLLFIFASFIKLGKECFIILAFILFVDVLWALLAHAIHYSKNGSDRSIRMWSGINFVTIVIGFFIYIYGSNPYVDIRWVFFVVLLVRAIIDYLVMKSFYFPR